MPIGVVGRCARLCTRFGGRRFGGLAETAGFGLESLFDRRRAEKDRRIFPRLVIVCETWPMTITGLHHVQLSMPSGREDEATSFYEGLLGIPRVTKPPHLEARGGCWFESSSTRIHLGVEDPFSPARKAHPAMLVTDLKALRVKLEAAGVEVADDQPLPGFDRFYAYDPFGNRLELLAPLR